MAVNLQNLHAIAHVAHVNESDSAFFGADGLQLHAVRLNRQRFALRFSA